MRWLPVLGFAALACLAGCTTQPAASAVFGAAPGSYESAALADGGQLVLQCERKTAASTLCQFSQKGGRYPDATKTAMDLLPLTVRQQYLKRLVAVSASEVTANLQAQRELPLSEQDKGLLRDFEARQESCLTDEKVADLLLVCPVPRPGSNAVVMFIRGLCDRCRFEPLVLRKIK